MSWLWRSGLCHSAWSQWDRNDPSSLPARRLFSFFRYENYMPRPKAVSPAPTNCAVKPWPRRHCGFCRARRCMYFRVFLLPPNRRKGAEPIIVSRVHQDFAFPFRVEQVGIILSAHLSLRLGGCCMQRQVVDENAGPISLRVLELIRIRVPSGREIGRDNMPVH